jgi:sugar lactone lactonase YvrE
MRRRCSWILAVACVGALVGGPLAAPAAAAVVPLRTVATFDPTANELPEGLAVDKTGNLYVGFAFTGEIRKIAPDGTKTTVATLPVGQGLLLGLAVDGPGEVYAALGSFDPATHGVWEVTPEGSAHRLAALDPSGLPNALAFDDLGNLYASDSFLGVIWRIPRGSHNADLWVQDPLLAGDPESGIGFGANGLAFWRGDLYVGNTDQATVVRVPVAPDGTPGAPRVWVHDPQLRGADGLQFDVLGNAYVTTDGLGNSLARVTPDRSITTLATADDGLDYAASIAFGQGPRDPKELFVANVGANFGRPSVMVADIGVAGMPLP